MKVDVTSVSSYQKQLSFTLPPARVKSRLDTHYKRLAGRVRLRGFRPGKAPRRVLEARFGDQVRADVMEELMQSSYAEALRAHELDPVSQPAVQNTGEVNAKDGFSFTIMVDVRPEVQLDAYTGLDVVYPTVEVTSEEIDQQVEALRASHRKLAAVEGRASEEGDLVLAELTVTDGDETVHTEAGSLINTAGDPWFQGVESLLIGVNADDEPSGEVEFAASARTETLAGKTLQVAAKVHAVQAYETPDLTDEFIESVGYEGGETGLRAALEAKVRESRDAMARNQARANLLEVLIDANKFDVPRSMVDQSLNMLVHELRNQQAYATGRDPKTITFDDAQLADLRIRAQFAAKAGLILEYVTKVEDLAVTDDDLEAKYAEFSEAQGQTVEAVRGFFGKDNRIEELKDRILEEKTLDWLLERANLVAPSEAPAEEKAAAPAEAKEEKKAAPKKEKKAAPKKEKKEEPAAAASDDLDLSFLKGSVAKVKEAMATGDYDAHLDAVEAAETAGKSRKGALAAIASRR